MPVAGLPAAEEASLSSLLETQVLSSWKVVGGHGTSTVVLRFSQRDSRPLPASHYTHRTYRTKPPSQQRRDQRRSEIHRANREQTAIQIVALENAAIAPTANSDFVLEDTRNAESTHQTAVATLTSDPLSQASLLTHETADAPRPTSDHQSILNEDLSSPPAEHDEITVEFFQDAVNRMVERITEKTDKVSQDIAEVREQLADANRPQATPDEEIPASHQSSSKPPKEPDLCPKQHHHYRYRLVPPDEGNTPDPPRSRPTTRHRTWEDDDAPPPRGRSVGAKKKK